MSRLSIALSKIFPGLSNRSKGKKKSDEECFCKVLLLDDSDIKIQVQPNSKGEFVLDRIFEHLNLVEKEYFGLRFVDDAGQSHWLDPSKLINSQIKSPPPHTLYFGVKFYAADPCKLKEELTRYQFFLQLKRDILQGRLPVSYDDGAELFAHAVQSELGDYDSKRHSAGYTSEFRFMPNQTEQLEERIHHMHKRIVGMVPASAEYNFLEKAKWLDMYGVDLHPVLGEKNEEYFLGLTPTGIVIYRQRSRVGNYFWPRITKVTFRNKLFMIRVKDKHNHDNSYAFELASKAACKHLWKCCVEHHSFFRLTQTDKGLKSRNGKILHFGSKHRYSGRTQSQLESEQRRRIAPQVHRTPSKRYARRDRPRPTSVIIEEQEGASNSAKAGNKTKPSAAVSSSTAKGVEQLAESPKSARSAPWNNDRLSGLYTGRESPASSIRSDMLKFPRRVESDSESAHRRRHHHRHRHRGKESDGETSDASSKHHRKKRSGYRADTSYDEFSEAPTRDNYGGSMSSVQSTESRRQRNKRRSKSPSAKPRLPSELKQHFVYELVETEGMDENQLKDIAYTEVTTETDPYKMRHRNKRDNWNHSASDVSGASRGTAGPPAYSSGHRPRHRVNSSGSGQQERFVPASHAAVPSGRAQQASTVKTRNLMNRAPPTNSATEAHPSFSPTPSAPSPARPLSSKLPSYASETTI